MYNDMKKILTLTLAAALLSLFQLSAQIDRSKAPEAGPAPVVEFGDFEKFTLDNGLRVILVEDHDRPLGPSPGIGGYKLHSGSLHAGRQDR